ncbi:beta-1,6-N-acetylglucosaminyltransferase [Methylobacterium flocculans]|uniref:beta-1,6-N-acetylglucosaminyltransferase n=1 Tax=Methylobacterium flocculans TaxID=2984843 RepID=UPI0021F2E494|nr:beta-1,6-N-acetylglucosaminyltransferase [Methylobacterium sp. FF17]
MVDIIKLKYNSLCEMPLAFIVLAHDDWNHLKKLVQVLSANESDTVIVHIDKRARQIDCERINDLLSNKNVFLCKRQSCHWGDFSLVSATLNGIQTLIHTGREFQYTSLVSGHDYPTQSIDNLKQYLLQNQGKEFIESYEMSKENWTVDGLYENRYRYYFTKFSIVKSKHKLTMIAAKLNSLFKINRSIPYGLKAYSGSQWWTITKKAVYLLNRRANEKSITRFFETTLIPDEMFFQTLINNSELADKVVRNNLRYISWNKMGRPRWLTNESFDDLRNPMHFFARKIASDNNKGLVKRLDDIMGYR